MKQVNNKEIAEVLTIMADTAQKMLKGIKASDTIPTQKAESMLKKLKKEYFSSRAAE